MDAKSPHLCLLLEAPVLPYAATALSGLCLSVYGAEPPDSSWIAWLVVLALCGLLCPGLRRLGMFCLVFAFGLSCGLGGRPPDLTSFDLEGPVEFHGRVASHLRGAPGEEWLWLRVEQMTQRDVVLDVGLDVLVGLPDGERPAEAQGPAWGQSVRLKGYLRTSPPLDTGGPRRDGPWRLNVPSWRFWDVTSAPPVHLRVATNFRAAVELRLAGAGHSTLGGKLRRALVTGSPDDLPESLRRGLRATGLSHLLAVSGLHVGLLATWLWLLAMPLGRRTRLLLALVGVAGYLLLVGPKASAIRAAGMAAIVAMALCLRRPPQALNAVALWATLLALWNPQIVGDLGFRLSVSATAGILALGPYASAALESLTPGGVRLGGRSRLVCQGLGVSLAAQISTLPFLTPWTALVHPASPVLNLLAIPWLTLFLGLSCLSLPLPWLDFCLVPCLDVLALPLSLLADAPPSAWTTFPVAWSLAGCLALSVAVSVVLVLLATGPVWTLRVGCLLLVLCLQGSSKPGSVGYRPLEFVRLDVGQGDALLLRDGPRTLLVDGGGWRRGDIAARVVVPALARLGVRRLDGVVLTHPDTDHCRGLLDLSSYLAIGEVWASPGWDDECALDLLARRGVSWRSVWRGHRAEVGRWDVEVLWPSAGSRRGEPNDRSLVLRASVGRQRILLMADVPSDSERRLLRLEEGEEGRLRSTIFGVGHHGSKTSTSGTFLDSVFQGVRSPVLATIGVGARNAYGHPHPTVVERLERSGVRVHRTDLMGTLRLRFDPGSGSGSSDHPP